MHNLSPLTTNCLQRYLAIVNNKHNPRRDRLLLLRPQVDVRYQHYQANFNAQSIHSITRTNYTAVEEEDLLHCFSSPTKSLDLLIKDIKENQQLHLRGTCQYCGINSDSTVDHYLPESLFPDYCVNALNLFPCCPDCNSNKSSFWYNAVLGSREIINLYLDTLPNVQYLFLNFTYVGNVPSATFSLSNVNNIPAALFTIIDRHFYHLKLLSRYKDKFNSEYHTILRAYKGNANYLGKPNLVQQNLLHDATQSLNSFGANSWKGIIKQTLANNNTFLTLSTT